MSPRAQGDSLVTLVLVARDAPVSLVTGRNVYSRFDGITLREAREIALRIPRDAPITPMVFPLTGEPMAQGELPHVLMPTPAYGPMLPTIGWVRAHNASCDALGDCIIPPLHWGIG